MRVLVTGATGFVGRALIRHLVQCRACEVRAVDLDPAGIPDGVEKGRIGSIGAKTDWTSVLSDIDVVVHLAARVHIMHDVAEDPLAAFREVNTYGTLNFARQAANARVRRFVFVSSVKVNGEGTLPGKPYRITDDAAPVGPYGVSKWEAEQGLRQIAGETGMESVIVRPTLVYGPGVKANFRRMIHSVSRGIPLPLGSIRNKRSLVALPNLVDLLATMIEHTDAANRLFFVSDDDDVSTPELLRRLATAMGKRARLLPVPESWLRRGAAMVGKGAIAARLCGSLQVDITETKSLLNWRPPVAMDTALAETVKELLASRKS